MDWSLNATGTLGDDVPVHSVSPRWLEGTGIELDILRLDLLHPTISGNKWFKLKPHLQAAQKAGQGTVMSFGGAWSNHLHALAAAGKEFGFRTIGVIRGEQHTPSAMLQDAERWGMVLHYVCRSDYHRRYEAEYQQLLVEQLGYNIEETAVVPEGGSGVSGVQGCESILAAGHINPRDYDEIWLGCGTGSTLAGVTRSVKHAAKVQGVAVLKGADFLRRDIAGYLPDYGTKWALDTDNHCGGYGKAPAELLDFINEFELDTNIPLDQIYTGKVMLALKKKIGQGGMKNVSRLLMIHTGGLQGKRGIKKV